MSSPGISRSRQVFFTLLLAGFGLIVALIAGEGLLRLVDPPLFDNRLRTYDPELGWRGRPGILLYRPLKSRVARFEVNRLGFRDQNHNAARAVGGQEKMRDIRRILIFGDSFTESAQVERHETFWSLLKDRLNANQDQIYWEVQSFGVGDWGTTQEWLAYKKYGRLADLVILQVFPLNDVANNSLSAANLASSQDAFRPYFDPATQFRDITYVNPRTTWIRQRSKLGRYLIQIAAQRRGSWGGERYFKTMKERFEYADRRALELGLGEKAKFPALLYNSLAYQPEQFDFIREGWQATDMGIRRVVRLAQARKDKVIVMVVPHVEQLRPYVDALDHLPFTIHPTYGERRIRNLLEKDGVPVVGLVEEFEANLDTVTPYLEGHFNRPTHHMVADRLEAEVRTLFPE